MPVGPRADTEYMSQRFETPRTRSVEDRRDPPMTVGRSFSSLSVAMRFGVARSEAGW